ncbi:MAG: branched-chain amino acid ABC transporter substrate-binding protein [Opitutus sp.]|nr:branched-chain amino acid ABC transporter substrate-binding protein [Opitutus sp.]
MPGGIAGGIQRLVAAVRRHQLQPWVGGLAACAAVAVLAAQWFAPTHGKNYDPGASDTEIKIGNIMPYSGPASAYGTIGKVEAAYFRMINEQGGINGRKINFVSLDGAASPPKTVEMARRLVEQEQVLLISGSPNTAANTAIQAFMNEHKVPQLFVLSGAHHFNNPASFPWTTGFLPPYSFEGTLYARHILQHTPNARIGVLYQNDDFGKDLLQGLKDGLGAKAGMIVAALSYEISAPTVDSQIVQLKGLGLDVLVDFAFPKATTQAIRKAYDIGWKPVHYIFTGSRSRDSVLLPAGLEKSAGIISSGYFKDVTDPALANDPAVQAWTAFMKKYYPEGSLIDGSNVSGYLAAEALFHVLRQAGDILTRENIMKQAAGLKDVQLPLLLPGITLNTSPTDYAPLESLQLMRFDGQNWVLFGEVMGR